MSKIILIFKSRTISFISFILIFFEQLIDNNKYQLKLLLGNLFLVQSSIKTDYYLFFKLHKLKLSTDI